MNSKSNAQAMETEKISRLDVYKRQDGNRYHDPTAYKR